MTIPPLPSILLVLYICSICERYGHTVIWFVVVVTAKIEKKTKTKRKMDTRGHSPKLIVCLLHFSLILFENVRKSFPNKRPLRVKVFTNQAEDGGYRR